MASGSRASITIAVLYAAYRAYAVAVSPLTTPMALATPPPVVERAGVPRPSAASDVARQHLPGAAWAADADYQLNRGQEGFVYFGSLRRIEDDRQNKVRLKPFALVWFDPRRTDGAPYTVTCASAVVEFENQFLPGLGDSDPGRIVGGSFEQEVRVAGPDGLELNGKNFFLSEKDANLYSSSPISFAYGPAVGQTERVRGRAEWFNITLTADDESILGNDMPRIGGMEKFVLGRDVLLDLVIDDHGRPLPITLQCKNGLVYNLKQLEARFNGDVHVSRPTHAPGQPEQSDRLHCDLLSLQFEPKEAAAAEVTTAEGRAVADQQVSILPTAGAAAARRRRRPGLDLDLQLRQLSAIGREVVMTSDQNEFDGHMGELDYDVLNHRLRLRDHEHVRVQVGVSVFQCPDIRLLLDDLNHIQAALCEGPGKAWHIHRETSEINAESSWSERLTFSNDSASQCDLLELQGNARVVQQQPQSGIMGDVLRIWLRNGSMHSTDPRLWESRQNSAGPREFPLRKVIAEQTGETPVAMVGPGMHLKTGRLEVEFAEPHPLESSVKNHNPFGRRTNPEAPVCPVNIKAGAVHAAVRVQPATTDFEVSQLTATTDVQITRDAPQPAGPVAVNPTTGAFFLECEQLTLTPGAAGHVLQLVGAPARIGVPQRGEIEGNNLVFDSGLNTAHVTGPGTMLMRVERDFEGRNLEESDRKLSVRWQEQMHFDGQLARFLGQAETRLADSMMSCDQLDVTLDQHVDFLNQSAAGKEPEIAKLLCEGGVTVKSNSWQERTHFVGIREMHVAEFFYDRSTGGFHARGPGEIKDWQRGEGRQRVRLGPQTISRSNQAAAEDKLDWNYTRLEFSGDLKGSQSDRHLELHDRVRVLHGPVKHALVEIVRDELDQETQTAKNTVYLESDQMNFYLRPAQSPQSDGWVEVVAFGNANLEGKVFGANADSIKYNQSKELFTLKGKGTDAGIWYQEVPGSPARRTSAKSIQFEPSRKLILDGTTGMRISQ